MDVIRLQADLQVAELRHRAKRTPATAAVLEKAKEAYEKAIVAPKNELLGSDNETSETSTNELDAAAVRRVILDFVTGLTLEELEEFKAAVDAFWRGPAFASQAPLPWSVSGSIGRSNVPPASQPAGDATVAENSGSGAGESSGEASSNNLASTQPEAGSVSAEPGVAEPNLELVTETLTPALPAITQPATPAAIPAGTSKKGQATQKKTKETAK